MATDAGGGGTRKHSGHRGQRPDLEQVSATVSRAAVAMAAALRKLTLVLAQSEEDRRRFVELGVPPGAARTAGNLKYDVRAAGESAITRELREHLPQTGKSSWQAAR